MFFNLKVLLVEDDKNSRATVKAMLKDIGFIEVFEATNGAEAQDFMQNTENKIDLIICDWNMPQKNGYEFLKDVRKINETIPFLMTTARADENSVVDAQQAGVSAYLRKPFPLSQLERKMELILRPGIEMQQVQ